MQQNNYKTELLYLLVFFGTFAFMLYTPENSTNNSHSSPISNVDTASTRTGATPFSVFPTAIPRPKASETSKSAE